MNIVAGIVLYNPNIDRLNENLESVMPQVDKLYIIDNASRNETDIKSILKAKSKIIYRRNKENMGIATALNQLMKYANGADWLLTLDQDSVVSENYIRDSITLMGKDDIAIISPNIQDINDYREREKTTCDYEPIQECITSGSLMNIKYCNKIGTFDENMFIDYVDYEYCHRVVISGYKIIRNNLIMLSHQLGACKLHSFWGFMFLIGNHKSIRHYYIVRNCFYIARKHRLYKRMLRELVKEIVLTLFFEDNKIDKMHKICLGIKDGILIRVHN